MASHAERNRAYRLRAKLGLAVSGPVEVDADGIDLLVSAGTLDAAEASDRLALAHGIAEFLRLASRQNSAGRHHATFTANHRRWTP